MVAVGGVLGGVVVGGVLVGDAGAALVGVPGGALGVADAVPAAVPGRGSTVEPPQATTKSESATEDASPRGGQSKESMMAPVTERCARTRAPQQRTFHRRGSAIARESGESSRRA